MPRFVILYHETPAGYSRPAHFDLMLEQGEALWTWALPEMLAAGKTMTADRLRDHRPEYLDYAGEVAGKRGQVSRVEEGEYELALETPAKLVVNMQGAKLQGRLTLEALPDDAQRWRVSLSGGEAGA